MNKKRLNSSPKRLGGEKASPKYAKTRRNVFVESNTSPPTFSNAGPDIPISQMIAPVRARLNNVRIFGGRNANLNIVVIRDRECIRMWGACYMMSIAGSASVNGYVLKPSSFKDASLLPVVAAYKLGGSATISGASIQAADKEGRIENRVKEVCSDDCATDVLKLYKEAPLSTCLLVVRRQPPPIVNILCSLYNDLLLPPATRGHFVHFRDDNDFEYYERKSIKQLTQLLASMEALCVDGARLSLITLGNKNSGKSTFNRILINKLLSSSNIGSVWLLDADIGQSEFTPSACISLTKVTNPITSPPCCHQLGCFSNAYLYGHVSVEDLTAYNFAISKLCSTWRKDSATGSVLIVNTMGFLEREGKNVLDHLFSQLRPDWAVHMRSEGPVYQVPDSCPKIVRIEKANCASDAQEMKPSALREAALQGHLYQMLGGTRSLVSALADAVAPYEVPFSVVTICLSEDRPHVSERMLFASLNCSLVALGFYETEFQAPRVFDHPEMPRIRFTRPGDEPMRILSYGIVRAIDIEDRKFFVLSPLSLNDLSKVTCFARPMRVELPSAIVTSQIQNDLPYVLCSDERRGKTLKLDMYRSVVPEAFNKKTKNRRL